MNQSELARAKQTAGVPYILNQRLMRPLRRLILVLIVVMPPGLKPLLYERLLGWTVHRTAKIGLSYIDGGVVKIGRAATVRHGNIFKNLNVLHLDEESRIINFNHFFADWDMSKFPNSGFYLGPHAQIMSRHFFDCSGGVEIGARAIVGGRDSQFWTHSERRDPNGGRRFLSASRISIGEGCYTGARVTIVGVDVSADCVVGAGAVVVRDSDRPARLIAGNPAVDKGPA